LGSCDRLGDRVLVEKKVSVRGCEGGIDVGNNRKGLAHTIG